jgi:hypothetical protein
MELFSVPAIAHLGMLAHALGVLASPPIVPQMRLSIAVSTADGAPVQDAAWIDERIAEAQRIYNPLGLYFRKAEVRPLDARYAAIETRADRDALSNELHRGFMNVFIVSSLRDVDDAEFHIMGVHWAPKGDLQRQYVIVAASARKTTLAHEIGHYLGLVHTSTPDNLMSYTRTGADVFLNAEQKQKVTTRAREYAARKHLLP